MATKRCPTCNQEFTDEWLTFCTTDGTSLVPVDRSSEEPPPTIISMPPSVSPLEQPTLDMPGAMNITPPPYRPPQAPPSGAIQPGWKVPPPPAYPVSTDKNLAILSLVLGSVSMTFGLCCYFGIVTGPVAMGLGIYALSLIKKDPNKYGGRGLAIGGIATGAFFFVILALYILYFGLSMLSGLT